MQEDRRRVLDMLAQGRITADEAERLLDALSGEGEGAASASVTVSERVSVKIESSTESGEDYAREDEFRVEGAPRIVVENFNGRVEIYGKRSERDVVRVAAEIAHPDRVEYSALQEGETIRVTAKPAPVHSRSFLGRLFANRGPRIRISAPRRSRLEVRNSNARVVLSGIEGGGSARTSNADINGNDLSGSFDMTTSNSRIALSGVEGDFGLRSSNGRIDLASAKGRVDAETSNASIRFEGEMAAGGDNRLHTSNGGVTVSFADPPSLRLSAETSNGSIRCSHHIDGETGDGKRRVHGRRRVRGVIGKGGEGAASLSVITSNGSITID